MKRQKRVCSVPRKAYCSTFDAISCKDMYSILTFASMILCCYPFPGLINEESEVVVRNHFDKISVRMPTYLTLSGSAWLKTRKRWWRPQSKLNPNTIDGSSVFKLCSVHFGQMSEMVNWVQPTSTTSHLCHFPINPFNRSHLKIDIKAQYVKADVEEGQVSTCR